MLVLFLGLCAPARAEEDWFDPAYIQGHTVGNGTGYIAVPAARVLENNWLSGGIHRYQFKLGFGLWDRIEAGIANDLKQDVSIQDILYNVHFHGRVQLLKEEVQGVDFSAGAENIGFEAARWGRGLAFQTLSPDSSVVFGSSQLYYLVAGRTVPYFPSMMATVGYAGGSTEGVFGNISKILFPGCLAEAEYDGRGTNLGFRALLSTQIKLDLAVYHIQDIDTQAYFGRFLERNIIFGISYTEPVQWGWLSGF